ncbi:hypothetical protein SAPIO_CDS9551 [Scedosporium apiospermum]|uniref:Uncharacterized protein n=1 Tax=Pseudallescheria apiosperma TaxID=563466 RepID=A0A084FX13_PSEDA|nr:uncharacterized protein SAPIO_CDS9551 [Scedosporium apiospermum]KEZ39625.1 hypothetical protein SAPIO_CDS9551 [Scedosporium apiospermum]
MIRQPLIRLAAGAMARPVLPVTLTTRCTARLFSSLPTLRPSILPNTAAIARPAPIAPLPTTTTLDVVPQTSISCHPAFMAAQDEEWPEDFVEEEGEGEVSVVELDGKMVRVLGENRNGAMYSIL